jgi:cell division protein FtsL
MATIAATLPVARTRPRRPRNQPVSGRACFPDTVFVKQIDNSRLRREVDREKRRECYSLLGLGILVFLVGFGYTWQHFNCLRNGYELESLKAQRSGLEESNRELRLEKAHLDSLERIDALARQELGLKTPAPQQVIAVDSVPSADSRTEVARNFAASGPPPAKPAYSPDRSAEGR